MWPCVWLRWRRNLRPMPHLRSPHSHRQWRLALWLACLFCWTFAMPVAAQSLAQPLTREEYRDALLAAIAELEAAPADTAAATLEALQARFETITAVEIATEEIVTVHSLLGDLNPLLDEGITWGDPARRYTPHEVALARLRGAVTQLDAAPHDNTIARLAILSAILARPEFNTPRSLWDRFWQWFEDLIARWLPDASPSEGSGWLAQLIRALPWIVTTIIVAVIIWLLSYWLQRLLRAFVTDTRLSAVTGDDDLPATAAEARQQARAAAESGLYRDAVRRLYLAALLQLAEHDLIAYERSLTNREVLVRVPPDSPIRPHLEPVIATFDQVWYGVREPDQATFAAYEAEIDTLAAVATRAATAPREAA